MKLDDGLQWVGAVFIIAGHVLNALGPETYPWNVLAFFLGTVLFLIWCIRVSNRPQLIVNMMALVVGAVGLVRVVI